MATGIAIDITDNMTGTLVRHLKEGEFEDLTCESLDAGGFTVASFTVPMSVIYYPRDFRYRYNVAVTARGDVLWEGKIDKTALGVAPDKVVVDCIGHVSVLSELWTTEDIIVSGDDGYKLSTFINSVMLADPLNPLTGRVVDTNDYTYQAGTRFEFAPATPYLDVMGELNGGNNYKWGVWEDKGFYYEGRSTATDWIVEFEDCSSIELSDNSEAFCNHVLMDYTEDNSHHVQYETYNQKSIDLYGVVKRRLDMPGKCVEADAKAIADAYLTECMVPRASASYSAVRLYDANHAEVPLWRARGGDVFSLRGWMEVDRALYGLDMLTTMQARSVVYNHDTGTIDITPNEFLPSVELYLARASITGYL